MCPKIWWLVYMFVVALLVTWLFIHAMSFLFYCSILVNFHLKEGTFRRWCVMSAWKDALSSRLIFLWQVWKGEIIVWICWMKSESNTLCLVLLTLSPINPNVINQRDKPYYNKEHSNTAIKFKKSRPSTYWMADIWKPHKWQTNVWQSALSGLILRQFCLFGGRGGLQMSVILHACDQQFWNLADYYFWHALSRDGVHLFGMMTLIIVLHCSMMRLTQCTMDC